ncbi:hypothetical protein T492DRAFT_1079278 [Pavlovales sp. CCMP2436]|nr:hypothetical protein T492DRAFT_1079278 [Pavlovales sp. CCMP2436]
MLALLAVGAAALGGLPHVTKATFNATVGATPLALVAFTAPWCGHCQKLHPELETASAELLGDGVTVVEIDATLERRLAEQFEVKAFPELLVFRRDLDTYAKYTGARSAQGIVQHMRARRGPACAPLSGASEAWLSPAATEQQQQPATLHVLVEQAEADAAGALSFETAERALEHLRVQVLCATPAGEPIPLSARVRLRFARAFPSAAASAGSSSVANPPVGVYGGADEEKALLRWMTMLARPAVGELTDQSARMYVGMRDTGVAILMLPPPLLGRVERQREFYTQQLLEVAQTTQLLQGPTVFLTWAHSTSRIGQQLVKDYPLDPNAPTLLILDFTKRARKPAGHRQEGPFDVRSAIAHVAAFKAGDLSIPATFFENKLEALGEWFEYFFLLVVDQPVEIAAVGVGVFGALFFASRYLDRYLDAGVAAAPAAKVKKEK